MCFRLSGVLVLCVVSANASAGTAAIDDDLVQRFRGEIKKAWPRVREAAARVDVDGTSEMVIYWNHPGRVESQARKHQLQIVRNKSLDGFRLELRKDSKKPEIFVKNSRYWFKVQPKDESEKLFLLSDGAKIEPRSGREAQQRIFRLNTYEWYIDAGTRIWNQPFESIFDDPEFQLALATYITAPDGHKSVRLEFNYIGTARDPFRYPSGHYWAEVNPDNSWLVDRTGIDVPADRAKLELSIAYQTVGDNVPFPKQIVVRRGNLDNPKGDHDDETVIFERPREIALPDDVFFLPAYGIPESAVDIQDPTWAPRWMLLNLGVIGIVVAVWLLMRKRHPAHGIRLTPNTSTQSRR